MTDSLEPDLRRKIDVRIPAGRWGTPEDVAGVIAFLLSDEARYVTGRCPSSRRWVRRALRPS